MSVTFLMPPELHAYSLEHWGSESETLAWLREETARMPEHRMQISPEQGSLMGLLVRTLGARRILEIGTFTGYSALAMAEALPDDGRLVALDVSHDFTRLAVRAWERAGVSHKMDLRIAPALESLAQLPDKSFDLAFIDADKPNYAAYFDQCVRLVRANGLILIDNVLWSGSVVDAAIQDDDTRAIRAINERVHGDARVECALIPIGDGLTVARVRPESLAAEAATAARNAQKNAYCPYSGYAVGAAFVDSEGQIWSGANVENLSFGATICAERSALAALAGGGRRQWTHAAVATRDGGTPCGMCLQVMAEFCADPYTAQVLCMDAEGREKRYLFADLLPHGFATDAVSRT